MTQRSLAARILAVLLAVTLLATTSVAQSYKLPPPGESGISREEQIQVGQKAIAEVYKQMPVLPDSSPITQYVQQLGHKLERVVPQQYSWPYQFHVIQQKEINAFAIPGGPVFINVGTITAADNEAELAGVMAHEMSHVYMQHSAKAVQKNTLPSILAGLGQIAGQVFGGVGGAIASMGGQIGGGLLSMKYSRAAEAEADDVGARIMYAAGYDPEQMAAFFQKLESQGGSPPQFLSDHPNPGNRVAAVRKEIEEWPHRDYVANTQAFVRVHQQAQSVRAYTAQEVDNGAKQGIWAQQNQRGHTEEVSQGGGSPGGGTATAGTITNVSYQQVKPSGNLVALSNNVFRIKYPDNWKKYQNQSGGGITIAPPAGLAENAIAYGVMINAAQGRGSLQQDTQQLVSALVQSNPGMRQQGSIEAIRVNGVPGRMVELVGNSPVSDSSGRPIAERDWLVTLPRPDGSLLYVIFIAPDRDFNQLHLTFENMLRSLRLYE